jgi:hypothetical protein
MSKKIEVLSREVRITGVEGHDYVCLTDIARYKDPERTDYLIFNWLRNRNTIEFLGIWEQINNPGFNPIEFDGIRKQAGLNSFILTAKQWIERTGAIGIQSKAGRYGGCSYPNSFALVTRHTSLDTSRQSGPCHRADEIAHRRGSHSETSWRRKS